MKTLRKIAIIGASLKFIPVLMRDIIHLAGWRDGTVAIHDLDAEKAALAGRIAERICRHNQVDIEIAAGDDPRIIAGADAVVVIVSTEVYAEILDESDCFATHGLYYALMDSYGLPLVRRLLHGLPNYAAIARTISTHAPGALVINITNPMGLLTRYLADTLGGTCPVFGLCSGFGVIRWVFDGITVTGGQIVGFNHCNFIARLDTPDGPLKPAAFLPSLTNAPDYRLSRLAARKLGMPLLLGDTHTLEFFPEWHREVTVEVPLYRPYWEQRQAAYLRDAVTFRAWAAGAEAIPDADSPAHDIIIPAIMSTLTGRPYTFAVNNRNGNDLAGVSAEAITESVVSFHTMKPTHDSAELSAPLATKLQEMDTFYTAVYRALVDGDLPAVIEATAYVYRETDLDAGTIADMVYRCAEVG